MKLSFGAVIGLAVVAGGGFMIWKIYSDRKAIGNAINPLSDQNLAYKGANAVVQSLSGNSTASLGTWLYDITHPGENQGGATPTTDNINNHPAIPTTSGSVGYVPGG